MRSIAVLLLAMTASRTLSAQGASLTGAVLAESGERPLANAEVLITDLKLSTRSDSTGKFLLTGVTPGKHAVLVRLVGYESFTADITFGATQKVDADILLTLLSTKLKKVEVNAKADDRYKIKLADFEDRRKMGMGRFLTPDVFENEGGRPLSAFLVQKLPGIRIGREGSKHVVAGARNGHGGCYVQVIVNGIVIYNGLQGKGSEYDIDAINSSDVVAIEYYTVATTPLQFNGTGGGNGPVAVPWSSGRSRWLS